MEMVNAELINVVGFPIAVCIALFWLIRDITNTHKETLMEFKQSVDSNTQALNTLIHRFEKDK